VLVVGVLLLPGVVAFAAIAPAALVSGSVVVAGAAAPEVLEVAELLAPTTTSPEVVETTTTTTAPEDPGPTLTEEPPNPTTTTTTIAPAPPRADPPPRPKPPTTTTTEAPAAIGNYVNQAIPEVSKVLDLAGVPYSVTWLDGPSDRANIVVAQLDVAGGVKLTVGRYIEPGAEVPGVIGMEAESARQLLEAEGYVVQFLTKPGEGAVGLVLSQDGSATVTLTIGGAP
jgi:hypothetical protein